MLNFAGVLQPGDLRITVNFRDRSNRSHLPHPIIIFIIVIIVVVIVVVVIVCVITSMRPALTHATAAPGAGRARA